MEKILII